MNKKNQGVSLKLNKFDMNRISDDSVVVLIGKRNTGKSYLFQEQKVRIDFIQKLFLQYLFTRNILH